MLLNQNNVGQIIFTGITVNDLLLQIEQRIEAKFSLSPQTKKDQSDYITRKDASKLLRVSLPTLHDWTKLGYLKAYKISSRVLYKECEVRTSIEKLSSLKGKKGVKHG